MVIWYFVDTIEKGDRGWKEGQRQGDSTDNFIIFFSFYIYITQPLHCMLMCLFYTYTNVGFVSF